MLKLFGVFSFLMSMFMPMLLCGIRFADGDGEGGGGDPGAGAWIPETVTDEGVRGTLSGFESSDAAFAALHEGRSANVSSILSESPDLLEDDFIKGMADKSPTESVQLLAKEVKELRSMKGRKGLVAPGADAPDAEKEAFQKELNSIAGVPESVDGYEYDVPEDIMKMVDQDQFKARLGEFHEANFTSAQVQAGLNMFFEEAGYVSEKAQETIDGWKAETDTWAKEQWGAEADANTSLAQRAMQKMGVLEDLQATGYANKKGIVDSFYQLAKGMGEGNLPEVSGGNAGSLKDQLTTLKKSPAYMNPRLRVGENANIMGDVMELQKRITAGES